jgi:small redox-active disulfide protein 2
MVYIRILGSEILECKELEEITRDVADSMGIEVEFEYVTDNDQIMEYPILSTPGLVVQGELVSYGRIPAKFEIENWLTEAN